MYRPWVIGLTGVEFEFAMEGRGRTSITEPMVKHAVQPVVAPGTWNDRSAGWRRSDGTIWDFKTDSSAGWELASPAFQLDESGRNAEVDRVCHALNSIGAVVTTRCGTHQHHDTPGYDWQDMQRFLALWARWEPFFFELQPASRRVNSYTMPIHRNTWAGDESPYARALRQAISTRRQDQFEYHARELGRGSVNLAHWWRTRRIEVRLHSGTLNAVKVFNWAMLIKALIQRVKQTDMPEIELSLGPRAPHGYSTEYVAKQLGLLPSRYKTDVPDESKALVRWLKARWMQFNPGRPTPPPGGGVRPVTVAVPEAIGTATVANGSASEGSAPEPSEAVAENAAPAAPAWDFATHCSAAIGTRSILRSDHVAVGTECPNARVGGTSLCEEHLDDFNRRRPYRDTRPVRAVQERWNGRVHCHAQIGGRSIYGMGHESDGTECMHTQSTNGSFLCPFHYIQDVNGDTFTPNPIPPRGVNPAAPAPAPVNAWTPGTHCRAIIGNTLRYRPNRVAHGNECPRRQTNREYGLCTAHMQDRRSGDPFRETRGPNTRPDPVSEPGPDPDSYLRFNSPMRMTNDLRASLRAYREQRERDVAAHRPTQSTPPVGEPRERCAARIGGARVDSMNPANWERECFVDTSSGAVECPMPRQLGSRLCIRHHDDFMAGRPLRVIPWPGSERGHPEPEPEDVADAALEGMERGDHEDDDDYDDGDGGDDL